MLFLDSGILDYVKKDFGTSNYYPKNIGDMLKKIDEYIQKENNGSRGIFGKKDDEKTGDQYVSEYNESHKDDFVFKATKAYQEQKNEKNLKICHKRKSLPTYIN